MKNLHIIENALTEQSEHENKEVVENALNTLAAHKWLKNIGEIKEIPQVLNILWRQRKQAFEDCRPDLYEAAGKLAYLLKK